MNDTFKTLPFNWGRRHRAYIRACNKTCVLKPGELAALCGYADVSKFQRRRQDWGSGRASGKGLVPVAFLNAIGVRLCQLAEAVECDRREYEQALHHLSKPADVITCGIASLGICIKHPLPSDLEPTEVYGYIQALVDSGQTHEGKAQLHWPSLMSVYFRIGKPPSEITWPPKLFAHGDRIDFGGYDGL